MMVRKLILGILVLLMVAGCAAPQSTRRQATPTATSAPAATATRARARPTQMPEVAATATTTPTVAPTATATKPAPTATVTATQTRVISTATPANPISPVAPSGASGTLLAVDPRKYPAPILLTPEHSSTFHLAQPVVHLTWSATSTELVKFGQTPGCVTDATNFRRAFESYQLVIRSLDAPQADIVQWTEHNPSFDLNLTTVPQGRYAWSVSVVMLCESYVVGQRTSTIQRSYLGPASPTSATRIVNWVP